MTHQKIDKLRLVDFFIHCESNGILSTIARLSLYLISRRLHIITHSVYKNAFAMMIYNFCDVDVVLDGHAYNEFAEKLVKNKNGENVLVYSMGEKLQNIGELVITPEGEISTALISDYEEKDKGVQDLIDGFKSVDKAAINTGK